jgi:hypothetical protein
LRAIADITSPAIVQKNSFASQQNHHRSKPQQRINPKASLKEQGEITSAPLLGLLSIYPDHLSDIKATLPQLLAIKESTQRWCLKLE